MKTVFDVKKAVLYWIVIFALFLINPTKGHKIYQVETRQNPQGNVSVNN